MIFILFLLHFNSLLSYKNNVDVWVFTKGEDFSPCRLQASLTRSAAKMRTPVCDQGHTPRRFAPRIDKSKIPPRLGWYFAFGDP